MEQYIPITFLNDFLFSKGTAYLQTTYREFNPATFQSKYQVKGTIKHANIENQKFSTRKDVLQGTAVYSDKYGLMGKIDIYDKGTGTLIERKAQVKEIYDGYKYQLYAQYFCLKEMGENPKRLQIRSMEDNKVYEVELPSEEETKKFENLLNEIRTFDPLKDPSVLSEVNAELSVYKGLSW